MKLDPERERRLRQLAGPKRLDGKRGTRPKPFKLEPTPAAPRPSQSVTPPVTPAPSSRGLQDAIDEAFERRACVHCPCCGAAAAFPREDVLDAQGHRTFDRSGNTVQRRYTACAWCGTRCDFDRVVVQLEGSMASVLVVRRLPWPPEEVRAAA